MQVPGHSPAGVGAQVWKNCWSTWVLRVPLVVSVWLINSWVTCRVREPPASRRWDPRVSPSTEEEVLKDPAPLPLLAPLPWESQETPPSNSPIRKGSVVLVCVVVTLLYSPDSGCCKSPRWLPTCGKWPGVGRGASQGMVPGEGVTREGVGVKQGPGTLPLSWDSMVMIPSRSGPKPWVVLACTLNL